MSDLEEDCAADISDFVQPLRNQTIQHGFSKMDGKYNLANNERHDSGIVCSVGGESSTSSFSSIDHVDHLFHGLSVCSTNSERIPEQLDSTDSVSVSSTNYHQRISHPIPEDITLTSDYTNVNILNKNTAFEENYDSGVLNSLDLSPKNSLDLKRPIYIPEPYVVDLYEPDEDGDTQVHNSIIQRKPVVALQIISLAADYDWLNRINKLSQTPLHLAVITNQPEVVRRLMVGGGQVDFRDSRGNTPLHIACAKGYFHIAEILLRPVSHTEIQQNKYEIPYQKIPQDLETRNYDGLSCMHLAAQGNHLKVMRILLHNRANINIADGKSGRTVLHYAAESGHEQLLRFLLQEPTTKIDEKTYGGLTAIALAEGRGYVDAVNILAIHGAQVACLQDDSEESEDDMDTMYDDIRIAGEPVSFST